MTHDRLISKGLQPSTSFKNPPIRTRSTLLSTPAPLAPSSPSRPDGLSVLAAASENVEKAVSTSAKKKRSKQNNKKKKKKKNKKQTRFLTEVIKNANLKFPAKSVPLVEFNISSTLADIVKRINHIAGDFRTNESRLPYRAIEMNGVVSSFYLRYDKHKMLPVDSEEGWDDALGMMEVRVDYEDDIPPPSGVTASNSSDRFVATVDLEQVEMISFDLLVCIYSPKKRKPLKQPKPKKLPVIVAPKLSYQMNA
eukprot:CAMPEP_0194350466 /NCGR_PEP_ID=MMETSP0171-20130528/107652_1 /TAXON_ID=218684 /ORGANISM="Corethron pennatum, Strain L29A3" /LENGTH=251 /DNA_ID=CAMNT_0039118017 /DNA_START=167 /DNA_END=923 /DNA_ORIENTATION=-